MPKVALELNLNWLVEHFGAVQKNERFAWVLGAGASYASRIPLGSQLVDSWLADIHRRERSDDKAERYVESWATAERLRIKYFNWAERASFYSQVYQRRFRVLPKEGYDYLETVMANKEPSVGYSILAVLLAQGRHNVVVTTNFDNLIADALSIYTDTFPLVIGHESLAEFANEFVQRPLICKIHRDLLLNPQNDSRSLGRLSDAWAPALRTLFRSYTPIFIGYGGNDATLMGLLESMEPSQVKSGLIWCYYEEKPSDRIRELVAELDGSLVKVPDFDLLMLLLGHEIGITALDDEIGKRAAQRTRRYRDRIIQLDLSADPSAARAVNATMERSQGWGWWREYQKARTESDRERRKSAFENAIELHQESAILRGLFATFMRDRFRDYSYARQLYLQALELDEDDATITGEFARLCELTRSNDEARRYYQKAIKLDPNNAIALNRFANFLWYELNEAKEAEPFYRRAAKLFPTNADVALDLATFVWNFVGSYFESEVAYSNALSLNPQRVRALTSYAGFRLSLEDYGEALRIIGQAQRLNRGKHNQIAAILLFYEVIILTIVKADNSRAFTELNALLNRPEGFRRHRWKFDRVLELVAARLPARHESFSKLAELILKSPLESVFEEWLDDLDK